MSDLCENAKNAIFALRLGVAEEESSSETESSSESESGSEWTRTNLKLTFRLFLRLTIRNRWYLFSPKKLTIAFNIMAEDGSKKIWWIFFLLGWVKIIISDKKNIFASRTILTRFIIKPGCKTSWSTCYDWLLKILNQFFSRIFIFAEKSQKSRSECSKISGENDS